MTEAERLKLLAEDRMKLLNYVARSMQGRKLSDVLPVIKKAANDYLDKYCENGTTIRSRLKHQNNAAEAVYLANMIRFADPDPRTELMMLAAMMMAFNVASLDRQSAEKIDVLGKQAKKNGLEAGDRYEEIRHAYDALEGSKLNTTRRKAKVAKQFKCSTKTVARALKRTADTSSRPVSK